MGNNQLDVRGLSCPQPVIITKNAVSSNPSFPVTVLADSKVAVENIKRLLTSLSMQFRIEEDQGEYLITVTKEG